MLKKRKTYTYTYAKRREIKIIIFCLRCCFASNANANIRTKCERMNFFLIVKKYCKIWKNQEKCIKLTHIKCDFTHIHIFNVNSSTFCYVEIDETIFIVSYFVYASNRNAKGKILKGAYCRIVSSHYYILKCRAFGFTKGLPPSVCACMCVSIFGCFVWLCKWQ